MRRRLTPQLKSCGTAPDLPIACGNSLSAATAQIVWGVAGTSIHAAPPNIIKIKINYMKTLGIIGGLGPETTSEFYLEVIFGCQKNNNIQRPEILIVSVPMNLVIEREAIVEGTGGESQCVSMLVDAAKKLEKAGADFLVMPCNSLHAFIEDIRQSVNIPVLSILEETSKFLQEKNINSVGLISTVITKRHKLYERALELAGIKTNLPSDLGQAKIGKVIHNLVVNRQGNKEREELLKIIDEFKDLGISDVVLACTDLQLLIPEHRDVRIHDTMKILVEAVVKEILK
jgi:aspartate racemase